MPPTIGMKRAAAASSPVLHPIRKRPLVGAASRPITSNWRRRWRARRRWCACRCSSSPCSSSNSRPCRKTRTRTAGTLRLSRPSKSARLAELLRDRRGGVAHAIHHLLQFLARYSEVPAPVFHLVLFAHVDLAAVRLAAIGEVIGHGRYSASRLVAVS